MDAVLLAFFVTLEPGSRVADLGTGSGIIPLLLTTRTKDLELWGFELQEALAERAQRSVRLNGLDSLIRIQRLDLRRITEIHPPESFATVVCNPPYWPLGQGRISPRSEVARARHEVDCTLEEAVQSGQWLLRPGGRLALVHSWQRRAEVLETLAEYGLKLERWREVRHKTTAAPSRILVEAVKADKESAGAVRLPAAGDLERETLRSRLEPLVIYDQQGKFSPEVAAIYYG
jgi:tRNA1(Val) A37 N6-methylase TrmN6